MSSILVEKIRWAEVMEGDTIINEADNSAWTVWRDPENYMSVCLTRADAAPVYGLPDPRSPVNRLLRGSISMAVLLFQAKGFTLDPVQERRVPRWLGHGTD